jgi:tRNA modification GTPase
LPEPRRAVLRKLRDGEGVIDEALVLRFAAGESFTGEEVVELHTHGSLAVIAAIERVLGQAGVARPAEAVEFTRQALLNNRLDVSQVEGLSDLLAAETEWQRRQAQRLFSGALGKKVADWRAGLLRASALIEAQIDFADEELPHELWRDAMEAIVTVQQDLMAQLGSNHVAERVRHGFEVALIGAPNMGKSTLMNRLAGRDVAITSAIAGTTRDVVEVRMDVGGLAVTFLDTAGIREAADEIEQIGVARTIQRASAADLRIVLTEDGSLPFGVALDDGDIVLRAKADMVSSQDDLPPVSGITGLGVDNLLALVETALKGRASDSGVLSHERHRLAVEQAVGALNDVMLMKDVCMSAPEVIAEGLRAAVGALDGLVGRLDVEDILGEIFASFCIGK